MGVPDPSENGRYSLSSIVQQFKEAASASSRGLMNPPVYLSITFVLGGFAITSGQGDRISVLSVLGMLLSIILVSAATNALDDYFDYVRNVDRVDSPNMKYRKHPIFDLGITPSRMILYGIMEIVAMIFVVLIFSYVLHSLIFLLMIPVGTVISFGYTGPPLGLKYRGLGEITVAAGYVALTCIEGITYGIRFTAPVISFIFMNAILFALVLLSGNLRDIKSDKEAGCRTLAVRVGIRNAESLFLTLSIVSLAAFAFITLTENILWTFTIIVPLAGVAFMNYRLRRTDLDYIERDIGNAVFAITLVSLFLMWFP
ncbi:MAG: prenyltransferase [Candidatus Thermoplasmatota archaeon]|nr:prenyltransferase [Candidatus Thermoplasmatota archaeon]